MLKFGKNIWDFMLRFQFVILVITSLALALAQTSMVIMRYFLKTDFFGIEEIIIIPAFWLFFVGASYGTYKKRHISAELVSWVIKDDYKKVWIETISSFITLIICFIMTYWSVEFFIGSIANGQTSSALQIPHYIPRSSVLFGFLLMSLYFFVEFINKIKELFSMIKVR